MAKQHELDPDVFAEVSPKMGDTSAIPQVAGRGSSTTLSPPGLRVLDVLQAIPDLWRYENHGVPLRFQVQGTSLDMVMIVEQKPGVQKVGKGRNP